VYKRQELFNPVMWKEVDTWGDFRYNLLYKRIKLMLIE